MVRSHGGVFNVCLGLGNNDTWLGPCSYLDPLSDVSCEGATSDDLGTTNQCAIVILLLLAVLGILWRYRTNHRRVVYVPSCLKEQGRAS